MPITEQQHIDQLQSFLRFALGYIDAIPESLASQFPAMPGFDRDAAEKYLQPTAQIEDDEAELTLGERLARQQAEQEANKRETKDRQRRQELLANEKDRAEGEAKLTKFFEGVQMGLDRALRDRLPQTGRKMPNGSPYRVSELPNGKDTPDNPQHPYHEFFITGPEAWANENGLTFKFEYQHDGVGMESWYVVTLEPLEKK